MRPPGAARRCRGRRGRRRADRAGAPPARPNRHIPPAPCSRRRARACRRARSRFGCGSFPLASASRATVASQKKFWGSASSQPRPARAPSRCPTRGRRPGRRAAAPLATRPAPVGLHELLHGGHQLAHPPLAEPDQEQLRGEYALRVRRLHPPPHFRRLGSQALGLLQAPLHLGERGRPPHGEVNEQRLAHLLRQGGQLGVDILRARRCSRPRPGRGCALWRF